MLRPLLLWSDIVIRQNVVEDRSLAGVLATSLKLSLDFDDLFSKGLGHVNCLLGSSVSFLYLHLASLLTRPSAGSEPSPRKAASSSVLAPTSQIG